MGGGREVGGTGGAKDADRERDRLHTVRGTEAGRRRNRDHSGETTGVLKQLKAKQLG